MLYTCLLLLFLSCNGKSSSFSLQDIFGSKDRVPFIPLLHGDPVGLNMDAVNMMLYLDRPLTVADFNIKGDVGTEITYLTDGIEYYYRFDSETGYLLQKIRTTTLGYGNRPIRIPQSEYYLYDANGKLAMVRNYRDRHLSTVVTFFRKDGLLDRVEVTSARRLSENESPDVYTVEWEEDGTARVLAPQGNRQRLSSPFEISFWNKDGVAISYPGLFFHPASTIQAMTIVSEGKIADKRITSIAGKYELRNKWAHFELLPDYDDDDRICGVQILNEKQYSEEKDTFSISFNYDDLDENGNWRMFTPTKKFESFGINGIGSVQRIISPEKKEEDQVTHINKNVLILISSDGSHFSDWDYFRYNGKQYLYVSGWVGNDIIEMEDLIELGDASTEMPDEDDIVYNIGMRESIPGFQCINFKQQGKSPFILLHCSTYRTSIAVLENKDMGTEGNIVTLCQNFANGSSRQIELNIPVTVH